MARPVQRVYRCSHGISEVTGEGPAVPTFPVAAIEAEDCGDVGAPGEPARRSSRTGRSGGSATPGRARIALFNGNIDSVVPKPRHTESDPYRTARRALVGCAVVMLSIGFAVPVRGQVRGLPIFFEPTYPYDARVGLDFGHGGELDGLTLVAGGSLQFAPGNCNRFSISGSTGLWNPEGPEEARLTAGFGGQLLLNPCDDPLSVSAITFRLVTGGGIIRYEGSNAWSVPIGVGAGWKLPIPIAHLEPWIVPHALWRERQAGGGVWTGALSLGFNLGVGELFGLRAGAQCCAGGVAGAYGLSFWF